MKKILNKRLMLFVFLVALALVIRFTELTSYLTLANLQAHKEHLQQVVKNDYLFSVLMFIVVYVVVVGLSIPGATILTLAGGFLFGWFLGAVYVNISATIGALLAFLFSRYLAGSSLQKKYGERLKSFNQDLAKNGYRYLLTLRFIPLFPFFLINIFAGLTKIPLSTFTWTTSVGILPGSLVYAFAGSQLTNIVSMEEILSVKILLAFCMLGLFVLTPRLITAIKQQSSG